MKILSEQNKSNLLANGSNQNIIVSLNLDTTIDKNVSIEKEPKGSFFLKYQISYLIYRIKKYFRK